MGIKVFGVAIWLRVAWVYSQLRHTNSSMEYVLVKA